jgi:surface antigen
MRKPKSGNKLSLAGVALLLAGPFLMSTAHADTSIAKNVHHRVAKAQAPGVTKSHSVVKTAQVYGRQRQARSYGISCVPFARAESGIVVAGNAWQWWGNAAGMYARGQSPEPGSVLAFRANGRMRMGHVAVIARVVNAREVLIDHANWPNGGGRGGVSQAIPVVDVSENNDWSAVRVGLGNDGNFGSVYPTYGFIYDRPDTGVVEANRNATTQQVAQLNPAPRDLRQAAIRPVRQYEEVAQAPKPRRQVGLIMPRSNAAQ